MKRFLLVLTLAVIAIGCEKQRDISGQVFVVTKGKENIKLALVDVAAIPADKLPDFATLKAQALEKQKPLGRALESARLELDLAKALFNVTKLTLQYARSQQARDEAIKDGHKMVASASQYDKAKQEYDYFTSPKYYLDQLPTPVAVAKTDADGKFKLTLPAGKYAIAASSSRTVGKETEHYYWLVWVDPTSPTQSLMLSNDNQVETKCKECVTLP